MTNHTRKANTRPTILALALGLTCALSVSAQTTGGVTAGTTGSAGTTATTGAMTAGTSTRHDAESGFDWGWLGLLGLAGLMSLRRKADVPEFKRTSTTATR